MKRQPGVARVESGRPAVVRPAVTDEAGTDRLRPLWLGCLAALLAAAPVIPSESAQLGGGAIALVVLWLLLLIAWAFSSAAPQAFRWHGGLAVWTMLAVVLWIGISSAVMFGEGQPRATINAACQWLSFGGVFVLVRQLVRTLAESRAILSLMMGLAVSLAVVGYAQYFYENPRSRAEYANDPEKMLREAGIVAPPGTPQRTAFENRLASVEPFATFALTNSLAGFLAPWLIVAMGLGIANFRGGHGALRNGAAMLLSFALLAGCLVLTKSRTAYVAVSLGAVVLVVYGRRSGWRPDVRVVATVACIALAALLGGAMVGGLDTGVWVEAPKSLLYRFQYWQATSRLIRDYPWFGCGPGNFKQYYTAYKLPEASETIAEPHNFIMEIWANAGTPALLAFLAFLAAVVWQCRRGLSRTLETRSVSTSLSPRDAAAEGKASGRDLLGVRAIYVGGFMGGILGYLVCTFLEGYAPTPSFLLAWPTFGLATWWLYHRFVISGHVPLAVLAAASIVLLVNLLMAGGISFAGVATPLWVLLALTIHQADPREPPKMLPRSTGLLAGVGGLAAVGVVAWLAYFPVLRSEAALMDADMLLAKGQLPAAMVACQRATQDDPYSPEPWERLAALAHEGWLVTGNPGLHDTFSQACRQMLERDPRSAVSRLQAGNWWLAAYRRFGHPAYVDESLLHYRIATELYPNYNFGHAQRAWALHVAGEPAAKDAAITALRLDRLTPHSEQKLARQKLFDRERMTATAGPPPPAGDANAEQAMLELRNTGSSGD